MQISLIVPAVLDHLRKLQRVTFVQRVYITSYMKETLALIKYNTIRGFFFVSERVC